MLTINCEECGTTITDRSEAYHSPYGEILCWDCYYHDELYGFEDEPDNEYDEDDE